MNTGRTHRTEKSVGLYELPRRSGEAYLYRLAHPLAQDVLAQATGQALPPAEMIFDYTNHLPTISVLRPLVGQEGSLRLSLLTIESLDHIEDYLIIAALADNGQPLDVEQSSRLLRLPACDWHTVNTPPESKPLVSITMCRRDAILQSISQQNAVFFEVEVISSMAGPRICKLDWSARSRNSTDRSGRHAAPPQPHQPSRERSKPRNTSNLLRPSVIPDGARYLTPRTTSIAIVSSLSLKSKASSDKRPHCRSCSLSGGKSSERENPWEILAG